jgi:hypothetical protein
MLTEDDLRAAFRGMERHTPDAADVLRTVYDHPRRSARSWRLLPRGPRRHALRAGLALGAAGAVTAVAVIAAVAHGPATKATPIAAPALRTRLLAAIDTASGDVLYAHGGPAPGGGTWQSPAYPQPGQEVHLHNLGLGSDGTVFKDGEYSFTMPSGNDAANSYISNFDQGGLQLSGTLLVVNHFRHVWGVWHGHFILGFGLDAAGIRAEIANGQFKVVGRTELHGQQAVGLEINVPPNSEAPPHVTAARLWVDATTYLPMRQYLRMSNGEQNVTDYTFLPPTPENLAKLRPEIPAGYTHVSGNSADLFGRKPKTAKN